MTRPNLQQQFVGHDGRLTQEGLRVLLAAIDARSWRASMAINGTTADGVTGLPAGWVDVVAHIAAGASAQDAQIRFTNDGATWGAWQGFLSIGIGAVTGGTLSVDLASGLFVAGFGTLSTSGSLTVPAGCNGLQLRTSAAGSTGRAIVFRR